jgi:hypothetical protein
MTIPMFITITKPNVPKYETITFVCNTLEECQNKLIVNLKNIIYRQIDYPSDVDDFVTNYWYNDNSMDNEFFDYQLFIDNKWSKPWTIQELYEIVTHIIIQIDVQNSIYNDKNYYDYCSESDDGKEEN